MGICTSVEQSEVAIVEQCGRYDRTAVAGFLFLNPCHCESIVGRVTLRIRQLDVRCETKTKDNVFVTIQTSVQFQAIPDAAHDAFYKLTNPMGQITAYVFDVVRASVPKITLDEVFVTKEEIANTIKEELSKIMEQFGFEIIQTLVTDIDPAVKVKAAMNEINAAERLKQASKERAEAQKIKVVKAAEADAESKYLAGVGIARQRMAIVQGLRDSVQQFTGNVEGTTPKDVMDLVLVTQYFDTLKDLGASTEDNTLFIPHSPGAVATVAAEIRDGLMSGMANVKAKHIKGKEKEG